MSPESSPSPEPRRRALFIAVAGLALAGGATAAYVLRSRSGVPATAADGAARLLQLELPDAHGKPVAFAQWRGKPMLVNFWATWCPPCREEMPMLDRLADEFRDVQFVGISVDRAEAVQTFMRETPVRFPLPVSGLEISQLAGELGNAAMALPFTVFLQADGQVAQIKLGALKEAELREILPRLSSTAVRASSAK